MKDKDKAPLLAASQKLVAQGFRIVATDGTATFLRDNGLPGRAHQQGAAGPAALRRRHEERRNQLVFNTVEGAQAIADSFTLRQAALLGNIPYCTTVAAARAAVEAIVALAQGELEVAPLQSYFRDRSRSPRPTRRGRRVYFCAKRDSLSGLPVETVETG